MSKKTHTEDKKKVLYQLESVVKNLYPNHKTTNPYDHYLASYYQDLVIEDVLLFKRLLKSITLLGHKERSQENKRYISSYGDVLATIELMSQYTINDTLMNSYVQLKEVFTDNPFTKLQASRVLRKSIRTVEHYLQLWSALKLAEKSVLKQGSKHMYQFVGYENSTEVFDTMREDFEDYTGFVDLQFRT